MPSRLMPGRGLLDRFLAVTDDFPAADRRQAIKTDRHGA